jgi:hypothetical protein
MDFVLVDALFPEKGVVCVLDQSENLISFILTVMIWTGHRS